MIHGIQLFGPKDYFTMHVVFEHLASCSDHPVYLTSQAINSANDIRYLDLPRAFFALDLLIPSMEYTS